MASFDDTTQTAERRRRSRRLLVAALAATAACLLAGEAVAEQAWVRGGIRLNLRTEPGTQYRIIGVLETGHGVRVLARNDSWTQIRTAEGDVGWIPKGYLQPEPPPTIRLAQLEDEVTALRARLEESGAASAALENKNEELTSRDGGQRTEIARLSEENIELRSGRRWPEWITGASVLAAGMLLGAILHRNATRRPAARIRL